MSVNGLSIGIVIPAYNEENMIEATLLSLKNVDFINHIMVVDDGSKDSTGITAKNMGVETIFLKKNMGKSFAMKTGFEALKSDIIVFLDADLGESAGDVILLIEPICSGIADVTIAKFAMTPGKGGFGLVKALSYTGIKLLTGKSIKSVLSGQRAFKRSTLSPEIFSYRGFGIEFGMTVDLINSGVKVMEVDVNMTHRTTGRNLAGFIHRYRQFSDILGVLIHKLLKKFPRLQIGDRRV